jgi:hypothetical protein
MFVAHFRGTSGPPIDHPVALMLLLLVETSVEAADILY